MNEKDKLEIHLVANIENGTVPGIKEKKLQIEKLNIQKKRIEKLNVGDNIFKRMIKKNYSKKRITFKS